MARSSQWNVPGIFQACLADLALYSLVTATENVAPGNIGGVWCRFQRMTRTNQEVLSTVGLACFWTTVHCMAPAQG
jgi:hypothetical protein